MSRPVAALRGLRAQGIPTISNLHVAGEVYVHLDKRASSLKKQLFGYARGLPGEELWLKPLQGKKMMKWYWPSKFNLPGFHLQEYFTMQALRYAPKPTHESIVRLGELLGAVKKNRKKIQAFFHQIDRELLQENPTLQDLYSLYRTLFEDDPVPFEVPPSIWRPNNFRWTKLHPQILLALLESDGTPMEPIFSKALQLESMDDVQSFLERTVREDLSSEKMRELLYLMTRDSLRLPSIPEVTYENSGNSSGRGTGRDEEFEKNTVDVTVSTQPSELSVSMSSSSSPSSSSSFEEDGDDNLRLYDSRPRSKSSSLLLSLYTRAAENRKNEMNKNSENKINKYNNSTVNNNRSTGRTLRRNTSSDSYMSIDTAVKKDSTINYHIPQEPIETYPIGINPPITEEEEKEIEKIKNNEKRLLIKELNENSKLRDYFYTRHRFVDPLFLRKRVSFLDRYTRSRIKGEKSREIGARIYVQHPDEKEVWPDNKGIVTRKWPSPYH